jgi:asparagine synthase (glutamine-hydrolysing)
LYYFFSPSLGFIFASEIKTILITPWVDLKIDLPALYSYLRYQFVPLEQTLVQNIVRLQPGFFLTVNLKKSTLTKHQYWNFPTHFNSQKIKNLGDCAEELKDLLNETVKDQMLSDLPVGAFLSGGLDSSALVLLMKNVADYPIQTFSVGFSNDEIHDESTYAYKVAQLAKSKHTAIDFSPIDILEIFDEFILAQDEPIADPALLPTYVLSKEASKFVKVVLTGEGADEVFAGYPYYRQFSSTNYELKVTRSKYLEKSPRNIFFPLSLSKHFLKKYLYTSSPFSGFPYAMSPKEIWRLFLPIFRDSDLCCLEDFLFSIEKKEYNKLDKNLSYLQKALYIDSKLWLAENLMMKLDKMTMYHSLEGRVPFLNHKLVEFAFQLPDWMKIDERTGLGKKVLREAIVDILPDDIVKREKHGFNLPLYQWFKEDLRDFVYETFESHHELLDMFNRKAIKRLLNFHFKLNINVSRPLWVLICLVQWFEAMKRFRTIKMNSN